MASATKKTSAKGKKGKNKKKASGGITLSSLIAKRETGYSLIFLAGLLLFLIMLLSGGDGSVWNSVHYGYFGICGMFGYFLPLSLLFVGVTGVINRRNPVHRVKILEISFLFMIISGFIFENTLAASSLSFFDGIKQVFSSSVMLSGVPARLSGIPGAVLGGAFFALTKSAAVSNIMLSLLLIADLMLLFKLTLYKFFIKLEEPAKKVGEHAGNAIERTKSDAQKYKVQREERIKEKRESKAGIVNDFLAEQTKLAESGSGKKEEHIEQNDAPIASEFSDEPEINLFDTVSESVSFKEKNKEKPAPLSEGETKEIENSLSGALENQSTAEYKKPPLSCLKPPKVAAKNYSENELRANGDKLIAALKSFNVNASIVDVVPGPTVTRYELLPAPGVKISKFVVLADDLALHMASPAGLRIEAPIPNKSAIGIEIPNRNKVTVTFREVIDTDKFRNSKSRLNVALGKDITGDPVYSDLAKMPHLLVAGTTGSGKSVCLNTMIASLLYNASPEEVRLLLIDPKQVEFGVYNGLPHLLVPVVSDPRKASGALGWAVTEMLSRYKTLNSSGVRDIGAYNSLCDEREDLKKMPQIVIVIDELADLMTVASAEVEDSIQRLAQMARAAGMHLVIATQRPSVDVITGVIKSNIPSRIALTVKSQVDSRTIIDSGGAEKLMGNGDMLYYPVGVSKPVRVQGAYLADSEIENIVGFIKANGSAEYDDNVQQEIDRQAVPDKKKAAENSADGGFDGNDELFTGAVELFLNNPEKASISALQRHLSLGFAKAGRIMDTLEKKGIVGPSEGSKPRKVLITKAQWYEMNAMSSSAETESVQSEANITENTENTDTE